MNTPNITIIIPIYNAEAGLSALLSCVERQTMRDFEVLMIDDGSCDRSAEIAGGFAARDKRFQGVSQQNSGVSAARNRGLSMARGRWITFLDADDRIPDTYLETMLGVSDGADIVVCDVMLEENGVRGKVFSQGEAVLSRLEAVNALLTRQTINSGPCAKLFSSALIAGLRFPPLRTYEDILFVLDAFDRTKTVVSTAKTGYVYLQHESGAMGQMKKAPSLDIVKASDRIMQYITEHPTLDPACCYTTLSHLLQYAYPLARQGADDPNGFVAASRALYRRYRRQIMRCPAFPWKEKLLFRLFEGGYVLDGKRIRKVGKTT